MKKWIRVFLLTVCGVSAGWAQPDARQFPSDAKWVLHLDLKALNGSPMGRFARESLGAEAQRGLAALKAMSGIDLTNDVDSVVVCGKGDARAGGVLYAYGRFDIAKLTAIAEGGNLGEAGYFHLRGTLGAFVRRFELFAGYDAVIIKGGGDAVVFHGPVAGIRAWF